MNDIDDAILRTLAYFEQFNRALTVDEIFSLLWRERTTNDRLIKGLCGKHYIFNDDVYRALSQSSINLTKKRQQLIIDRRKQALEIAESIKLNSGVISIILMNSLATQTIKPSSDLDFLIIVKHGRLYTTRLKVLLKLKRAGLMKSKLNQAGKACLGYWLSDDDLGVWKYQNDDLTATYWVATMVPLYGIEGYRKFIQAN